MRMMLAALCGSLLSLFRVVVACETGIVVMRSSAEVRICPQEKVEREEVAAVLEVIPGQDAHVHLVLCFEEKEVSLFGDSRHLSVSRLYENVSLPPLVPARWNFLTLNASGFGMDGRSVDLHVNVSSLTAVRLNTSDGLMRLSGVSLDTAALAACETNCSPCPQLCVCRNGTNCHSACPYNSCRYPVVTKMVGLITGIVFAICLLLLSAAVATLVMRLREIRSRRGVYKPNTAEQCDRGAGMNCIMSTPIPERLI